LAVIALLGGCAVLPNPRGADCAQDGACPDGFTCFPDFRCYPYNADPPCNPPCYGAEPFCDKATLRCIECRADDDCTAGFVCAPVIQRCQPGCSAAHPQCPTGVRCDTTLGVCMGQGCTGDASCTVPGRARCDLQSGQCVSCLPGRDDCPSGTFCQESNGSFGCVQGCSADSECPATGPAQVPACCDHRCVDVLTSNDACGACGSPCRNNDSCCDGVCVDLTRSADHCGGCARSCYLPNVTGVSCANSQCSNQGCQQYFGNCDGDLQSNGCEANHSFSPLNCGSCGHVCPSLPHRPGVCLLLSCASTGPCEEGWGNCDGQPANGCERPLTTTSDCGGCDVRCSSNQACTSGTCQ
jgi:hypothetical protein